MLKPITARATHRRSSTKVAANNYAFEEYGLKPVEMAKAAKRIRAEIETARSREELTRFSGGSKTLKFSDAKKVKTKTARASGGTFAIVAVDNAARRLFH